MRQGGGDRAPGSLWWPERETVGAFDQGTETFGLNEFGGDADPAKQGAELPGVSTLRVDRGLSVEPWHQKQS